MPISDVIVFVQNPQPVFKIIISSFVGIPTKELHFIHSLKGNLVKQVTETKERKSTTEKEKRERKGGEREERLSEGKRERGERGNRKEDLLLNYLFYTLSIINNM